MRWARRVGEEKGARHLKVSQGAPSVGRHAR
jgi:hypothetical protein